MQLRLYSSKVSNRYPNGMFFASKKKTHKMKPYYYLTLLITFAFTNFTSAQDIKIKKNVVSIDTEDYLTFMGDLNGTTFSDLKGNDLFFLSYHTNTETTPAYTKVIFLKEKKIMTNMNLVLTRKALIKTLIENKALVDGKLNEDGIDIFILKFHEQIPVIQKIVIEKE